MHQECSLKISRSSWRDRNPAPESASLRRPQQFVCGLRGEQHRILAARPVPSNGVHAFVEIMEVACGSQARRNAGYRCGVQHLLMVSTCTESVVSALRDGQHARLGIRIFRQRFTGKRIGFNFLRIFSGRNSSSGIGR